MYSLLILLGIFPCHVTGVYQSFVTKNRASTLFVENDLLKLNHPWGFGLIDNMMRKKIHHNNPDQDLTPPPLPQATSSPVELSSC